jgi:hypothetical protein
MIRNWSATYLLVAAIALGHPAIAFGQAPTPSSTAPSEEAAVLDVIRGESAAFWAKDFEAWAGFWAHAPYVRIMGWWAAGGISVTEGWNAISGQMQRLMEQSPEPNPTGQRVRRENVNLRIIGDMALVTFDQYGLDTGDERMDMPGLSRETRVLEKANGRWKLVYVGWLLQAEKE